MEKKYLLSILIFIAILTLSFLIYKSQAIKRTYEAEVLQALTHVSATKVSILTEQDIKHLPTPVQRYLNYVGVVGKEKIQNYRIIFEGEMKMDPKKDWVPVRTEQYNFVDNPTRMFFIKAKMLGISVIGLDSYKLGKGHMLIKLGGLFTVADASGPEMDIGEAVTLLNDMCLMAPATLIDQRIQWKSIDSLTAKATFNDKGCLVSATLYFNTQGELTNFVTDDRYMTLGNTFQRAQWSTPVRDYKDFNGFKLPAYGEGIWHLPEGDYCYAKFNIKEVVYNSKGLYIDSK